MAIEVNLGESGINLCGKVIREGPPQGKREGERERLRCRSSYDGISYDRSWPLLSALTARKRQIETPSVKLEGCTRANLRYLI